MTTQIQSRRCRRRVRAKGYPLSLKLLMIQVLFLLTGRNFKVMLVMLVALCRLRRQRSLERLCRPRSRTILRVRLRRTLLTALCP